VDDKRTTSLMGIARETPSVPRGGMLAKCGSSAGMENAETSPTSRPVLLKLAKHKTELYRASFPSAFPKSAKASGSRPHLTTKFAGIVN
jgi:hypothetical protein